MEKQQIVDLIKQNPQMSYEEMKAQAESAKVPLDMFEDAWNETRGKKKGKGKRLKIIGSIIILTLILFFIGVIPIRIQDTWAKFHYSGKKTSDDCINISEKYAKKLLDDYKLQDLSIGFMKDDGSITSDKEGYTTECEVSYIGNNGDKSLYLHISKYFISKYESEENGSEIYKNIPNEKLINSIEASKAIKKYDDSPNILLTRMSYNKKTGGYVWGASGQGKEGYIMILIDATSGELVESNKR
jgi:hypothetical protein